MLFRRELVMFGPREVLLTSEEPVVKQFLNGRRDGPIGMSEEKDAAPGRRRAGHRSRRGHHARRRSEGRSGRHPAADAALARACPSAGRVAAASSGCSTCCTPCPQEAQKAIKKSIGRGEAPASRSRDQRAALGEQLTEVPPASGAQLRAARRRRTPTPQRTELSSNGLAVPRRRSAAGRSPVRALPRRRPADVQAAVPGPRVHPAGLVHRQRHDHPDLAGGDPVRRGHRAAARQPRRARSARSRSPARRACSRSCARPARSCARC